MFNKILKARFTQTLWFTNGEHTCFYIFYSIRFCNLRKVVKGCFFRVCVLFDWIFIMRNPTHKTKWLVTRNSKPSELRIWTWKRFKHTSRLTENKKECEKEMESRAVFVFFRFPFGKWFDVTWKWFNCARNSTILYCRSCLSQPNIEDEMKNG